MKVLFEKHVLGHMMVIHPRVQRTEEEPDPVVSLARKGAGCGYAASDFESHDGHSPRWASDGTAPSGSSAPELTADQYMMRIVEALKAAGANIEAVEIKVIEHKFPDGFEGGDAPKGTPPSDWNPYLN